MVPEVPIGEIIETTSLRVVAQRVEPASDGPPRPVQPPNLGSLVWARLPEGGRVFAVVSFGTTTGLDTGRRPIVRSQADVIDDRVYLEHPQLARVLRTVFEALLVGWEDAAGRLFRHVPPQPPPLHFAVFPASPEETARFSEDMRYFRLLLGVSGPVPGEQVLAAHVREVYRARGEDDAWREQAARYIAQLLKRDYERLRATLEAIA